jgi:pimeloyl-ACP methyl ester carboxylesterase
MRRLRILGLHGYHGSAELLRRQLNPLASSLDALADVVCVDAPSLAEGDFGWWHASEGPAVRYRGWTKTRDWLSAWSASHGAFDGVLGFSQGAALAALLVALCAVDGAAQPQLDFAMIVGGFASRDVRHAALFETPGGIDMPSLHIIGRSDAIVPPRTSHALASRFRAPMIVEHDGGHVIADTSAVRDAAQEFLQAAVREPPGRARRREAAATAGRRSAVP